MTTPSLNLHDRYRALMLWADKPVVDQSLLHRVFHFLARLILITIIEFDRNALSIRSGALTYTVLLSLVPILAMSTAVVKGLGGGDQLRMAAYSYIESLEGRVDRTPQSNHSKKDHTNSATPTPDANLTEHLRSAVDQLFDYVDNTNFATLGTFGVLGVLLSVILVLSHIESAMNTIWKVAAGRSFLRKLADYLTLLILMPLSINVAFTASAFLQNPTLASHIDILIPFAWIQTLLLKALPVMVIAFTLYVIYLFFPNTKVRTRPAMFGAALAAVLWFGIQNIYISLQVGVADYNAIYGSFATVPLFLVWIYLGWMFILIGAQVAFAAQTMKKYRFRAVTVTPALKLSVAFDIMDRVHRNFIDKQATTKEKLVVFLSEYPEQLVADIIAVLEQAEIIHVSQSDERLLPGSPLDQYVPETVIRSILGAETPDTNGGKMSRVAIEAAAEASGKKNSNTETTENHSICLE